MCIFGQFPPIFGHFRPIFAYFWLFSAICGHFRAVFWPILTSKVSGLTVLGRTESPYMWLFLCLRTALCLVSFEVRPQLRQGVCRMGGNVHYKSSKQRSPPIAEGVKPPFPAFSAIFGHFRPFSVHFRTFSAHFRLFFGIFAHFGLFSAILGHFRPFSAIFGHFLAHFWPKSLVCKSDFPRTH